MWLLEHGDTGKLRLTKDLPNDTTPEIPLYTILLYI